MKEEKTEKKDSFSGVKEPTKSEKVSKRDETVSITFNENRKFDLHIGRNMVTFRGRETKKVPAEWLRHRDWPSISRFFLVKGV